MIPESIGKLTTLVSLSLANNKLTCVPETIGNLKALTQINLQNNQLITLPESFSNLKTLQFLFISNNNIRFLPRALKVLFQTPMVCWIKNNPIVPISLRDSDNFREIRDYINFCINLPEIIVVKIQKDIPLTEHEMKCPLLYQFVSILEETCNLHKNSTSKAVLNRLYLDGRISLPNFDLKL